MTKVLLDSREITWKTIEQEIQSRGKNKDKAFILNGNWKKLIRHQQGYKIFKVDGTWVRNNLSIFFTDGGHGLVHEFIPINEIWVSSHHYNERPGKLAHCRCKTIQKGQSLSKNFFDSTVIHEIIECEKMKRGQAYWKSHQQALAKEKEAGLLADPYDDR